jgi:hypothetical protein
MDCAAEQVVGDGTRGLVRRGCGLAALLLALASGCVSSGQLLPDASPGTPPVNQVVAVWNTQVVAGVDPAHDGAPLYGVAGRVYLYGTDQRDFLIADGKLILELYAVPPEQPQGPAVRMQAWEIKKEILNGACLRRDGFGQGYTLNLPWESYRPDITHVEMRLRYEPARGMPVFGRSFVKLNSGPDPVITANRRAETGDRQPVATAPAPPPGSVQQAGGFPR